MSLNIYYGQYDMFHMVWSEYNGRYDTVNIWSEVKTEMDRKWPCVVALPVLWTKAKKKNQKQLQFLI